MDEEVGLHLLGRAQGELVVGTVQRVAGLEGDHPAPAPAGELGPQLRRCEAQGRVVVVGGRLDALEGARQVAGVRPLEQVGDARVSGVGRPENPLGLRPPVGPVDLLHVQGRQHHPLGVAQGHRGTRTDPGGQIVGDVESDRYGPEPSVGQPHISTDRRQVGATEEPAQRRERTGQQQLEVAQMAWREIARRPVGGRLAQLGGALVIHDAVDQRTTVRRNKVIGHSASVKLRSVYREGWIHGYSICATGLAARWTAS